MGGGRYLKREYIKPEMETLIQILEKTISSDPCELKEAEMCLYNAMENDFIEFIKILSDILVQGSISDVARIAAGLQLKNLLTSKDVIIKEMYQQRWLSLPEYIRLYIKKNILTTLGTENYRPSSAAQCVAYVAAIELPVGQWNDLIPNLTGNFNEDSTELTKEATLEAIRYICKDVGFEVLRGRSSQILTDIINCMRSVEPSSRVRLAATKALLSLLDLTKVNLDKENERNFIMEVVCDAAQSTDINISFVALQCLVKILSLYYEYMEPYMERALLPISLNAIKSEIDEISLQGIEFWLNVIQKEINLAIEEADAATTGRSPIGVSRFYVRSALRYLAPTLIQKLNKDEDTDFELEWSPPKAVSMCLMLLLTCYENEIVEHMIPFIDLKIKSTKWRYKAAAATAFDTVLGGVQPDTLKLFIC